MDNSNQSDFELFEEVWRRVRESPDDMEAIPAPPKTPEPAKAPVSRDKQELPRLLEDFMNDEASDATAYKALANGVNSRQAAATLRVIAMDEAGHLRRLQALYFLLTGDTYSPPRACAHNRQRATLSALRDRYWAETEGAKAYTEASTKYSNTPAGPLFASLAEDERRHSQAIASLIEGLFT